MADENDLITDLLGKWQYNNIFEKIYFLSLHILLLLLGISFLRRNTSNKTKCRSIAKASPVTGRNRPSQHVDVLNDCRLEWANRAATWLLSHAEVIQQTVENWKSKVNARLLQSCSMGSIQIETIHYEQTLLNILNISSQMAETEDQMNIIVHLFMDRISLKIAHSYKNSSLKYTEVFLSDLNPKINIQFVSANGRIKKSYKLEGLKIDDKQIGFKNMEENNIEMEQIRYSIRRALRDNMSLEITRGILKKEMKQNPISEQDNIQSEVSQEDSPKHILVTDIDAALAQASKEDEMNKSNRRTFEHLDRISFTSKYQNTITPQINILPATPNTERFKVNDDVFEESSMQKEEMKEDAPVEEEKNTTELKLPDAALAKDYNLENEECDKVILGDVTFIDTELTEENHVKLVHEEKGNALLRCKSDENLASAKVTEITNENESSRNSVPKRRPQSLYDSMPQRQNSNVYCLDENLYQLSSEKEQKTDILRVKTFSYGSKSLISIVDNNQKTESPSLRSTISQLSLASPVGYNPKKPSALIIETEDKNEKHYYHIPPAMAKKGNYDKRGTKLHVYNGHLFVAQHFSKTSQTCVVCSLPLTKLIGKQGYQCRDCKTIVHKRCHNFISTVCEDSSFASLNIEYLGSTDV